MNVPPLVQAQVYPLAILINPDVIHGPVLSPKTTVTNLFSFVPECQGISFRTGGMSKSTQGFAVHSTSAPCQTLTDNTVKIHYWIWTGNPKHLYSLMRKTVARGLWWPSEGLWIKLPLVGS